MCFWEFVQALLPTFLGSYKNKNLNPNRLSHRFQEASTTLWWDSRKPYLFQFVHLKTISHSLACNCNLQACSKPPVLQKLCSSGVHHLLFYQYPQIQSFTQHTARLKDFISTSTCQPETSIIENNMFFESYFQIQFLSNSLTFLQKKITCLHFCVLTAICQANILVRNSRSTESVRPSSANNFQWIKKRKRKEERKKRAD